MKIIITGSKGFVGQNLSKFLVSKDDEVKHLSLRSYKFALDNKADAIIHLAGKAHDTKNTDSESEYFEINRDLTIKLFDKFLASNIKDFIFFSSVKAVADTVDNVLIEDIEANPQTPYGKSKFEAEQYLLSKKLPTDKRLIIIRPCMIHGEGNKGNLSLLYKVVKHGIPWILASYNNRRSFISIDNLNFLIYSIIHNSSVPSGIYNVADDTAISTNELITIISKIHGKQPKLIQVPRVLIAKIAIIGDKLKLPLNSERLQKLTESYVVSNAKIKRVLNIDSLPLSVEEGLTKTIKSFRNE